MVGSIVALLFVKTFALSIAVYAYAAIGARIKNDIDLSAWWNPIGVLMKNRPENSKVIQDIIKSYIRNIPAKRTSFKMKKLIIFNPFTTNSKDLDLAMSVGSASNCTISVQKTNTIFFSKRKYVVEIDLSDLYDFEKLEKSGKAKIIQWINNGFGYYPQEFGLLKKYTWKIKHKFNYWL